MSGVFCCSSRPVATAGSLRAQKPFSKTSLSGQPLKSRMLEESFLSRADVSASYQRKQKAYREVVCVATSDPVESEKTLEKAALPAFLSLQASGTSPKRTDIKTIMILGA